MREDKNFKCLDIELDFWLISMVEAGLLRLLIGLREFVLESSRDEVISTNMICY